MFSATSPVTRSTQKRNTAVRVEDAAPDAHDTSAQSIADAMSRAQAMIEFDLDGTILSANDNFCAAMGYRLSEIRGRHHRIFVEPAYSASAEYTKFWSDLRAGQFCTAEVARLKHDGSGIFLQASYVPVLNEHGRPVKVIKFATDISATKQREADYSGRIDAINRAQAVIEFHPDGTIVHANDNFLATLGYRLDEVVGRHHRMFVEPSFAASSEYAQFWAKLAAGEYQRAEYKRIGKGGKEIWIEASYNPIFDAQKRVTKVVKFAIDVTEQKLRAANYEGQLAAISRAQAVIEFKLDGTIITANENFLATLGYGLDEVAGKHHSMFVDPTYAASAEYRKFWADLNAGTFQQAEYRRLGKGGRAVWIQASYNPIFDLNGKPYKVVKYAIDVNEQKELLAIVSKSAQALAGAAEELTATAQTNERHGRRDERTGECGIGRVGAGQSQRVDRRCGHRGNERQHPRDRVECRRSLEGRAARRQGHGSDRCNRREARHVERRNRQGDQGDHRDRTADQSAGAERHHRSSARW